jgi:peptidoglycan/LPS O-acetylase OafA/YrhL
MQEEKFMERKHYGAIDGLRTVACIGIVMMHIRANNQYALSGFIYDTVIASFTNFVFLFMVVSAFGMCCGYYDRMLNNQISLENFYAKRYSRILPFFAVLVLIDVIMSPSRAALIEGLADITLLFGFFPNDISVIGVGWFLGLIFAFYLIFPFYCVLIKNKKRAWLAFAVSVLLNYAFSSYFGIGRSNIVYSLPYLIAGGLIYLYREELENISRKYWWAVLVGVAVCLVLYYIAGANTITMLMVSSVLLIYALGKSGGYTAEQIYKVLQLCQHGSLSFAYGCVPCD